MVSQNMNPLLSIFSGILVLLTTEIVAQGSPIPGEIVVKFEPGVIILEDSQLVTAVSPTSVTKIKIRSVLEALGTTKIQKMFPSAAPGQTRITSPITDEIVTVQDLSQVFLILYTNQVPVDSAINNLIAFPEVRYAEPTFEVIEDATPNDPYYDEQWYLYNSVNSDFDIDAESAWDYAKGDDIIIALIENGIDTDHEDLEDHIWSGGGSEYGYGTSHGTYVAGIIAAKTNNNTGVAGIGWHSWLMPRRGSTSTDRATDIYESASNGADIINNSWHTPSWFGDPPYLREAVRNAYNLGAVLVASMGNNQEPIPYICYPAAYDSFVIAVGALKKIENGDTLYARNDMNYGPFIDVTAPGDSIRTTSIYGNGYSWFGMTSGSTPVVSGVAALIRAQSSNISNSEVMDVIRGSATLFNGWETDFSHYGHGMITAYRAVLSAKYDIEQWLTGPVSGTLTQNALIYGDATVFDDLVVSTGTTLVIEAGTRLGFANNKKLRVEGTLVVDGHADNRVNMTRSGPTGNWSGLRFENASVDNACVIKYTDIEYAQVGIRFYNASPTVKHSTISHTSSYGMYLYYSDPAIKHSTIDQASSYGMYLYHSDPLLKGNTIQNGAREGIYMSLSSPRLIENIINGNGDDGVYAYRGSPQFGEGSRASYGYNGYNVVTANTGVGISAQVYTDARLGALYEGGNCVECHTGGNNSIYSNTADCQICHLGWSEYVNVWSNENSAVRAEKNWWGSDPPAADAFIATNNSTLDYAPWLTSDPNRRFLAGSDGGSESTQGRITNPFDHTTLSGLNLARYLHSQGDNNAAFAQYQTVILNDPNSAQSLYALRRIVECFPGSSPNALVNYLNQTAASHCQETLGKLAGQLLVDVLADNGQYPQAITRCEDLLNDYPDDLDMQRNILYTMGTIYANDMNDAAGAAQAYSELLALPTLCTEDGMIENINLFFTNSGMTPRIAGDSPEDRQSWLPDEYALAQNIPNPFNPRTVIAYQLPEASQVILKVYDLTGREVETMVDRQEQAGFRQVTWNGTDTHGKPVASGLYIYTLSATSTESKQTFHQSRKLVLLR